MKYVACNFEIEMIHKHARGISCQFCISIKGARYHFLNSPDILDIKHLFKDGSESEMIQCITWFHIYHPSIPCSSNIKLHRIICKIIKALYILFDLINSNKNSITHSKIYQIMLLIT